MSYIGNSPGVASSRVTTTLTATAGQTVFTTQSGYVLGYVDVYLNGVKLVNGADFEAITGTYVSLFAGALVNDVVELVSYIPRGLTDGYTKSEADAKFLDVGGDTASGSLNLLNVTASGQLSSTKANSAVTGEGQVFLNGTTGNRIEWNTAGYSPPATTTRSVGTKLVLYPGVTASEVDYGLGIDAGTMWSSVPANADSHFFKWYGGTAEIASLSGTGKLTLTANPVISSGTANGVGYLNASKALTTGSALTFDGTTLAVTGRIYNGSASTFGASTWAMSLGNGGASANYFKAATTYFQNDSGTQIAQLDSTGFGIGTNSPGAKLTVKPNSAYLNVTSGRLDTTNNVRLEAAGTASTYLEYRGYLGHVWDVDTTEQMRLSTSGLAITGAIAITQSGIFPTTGFTYNPNGYLYTLGGTSGHITQVSAVNVTTTTSGGFGVNGAFSATGNVNLGATGTGGTINLLRTSDGANTTQITYGATAFAIDTYLNRYTWAVAGVQKMSLGGGLSISTGGQQLGKLTVDTDGIQNVIRGGTLNGADYNYRFFKLFKLRTSPNSGSTTEVKGRLFLTRVNEIGVSCTLDIYASQGYSSQIRVYYNRISGPDSSQSIRFVTLNEGADRYLCLLATSAPGWNSWQFDGAVTDYDGARGDFSVTASPGNLTWTEVGPYQTVANPSLELQQDPDYAASVVGINNFEYLPAGIKTTVASTHVFGAPQTSGLYGEALRITSAGKIGINQSAPVGLVHIGNETEINLTKQSLFVQGSKIGFAGISGLPQNQLLIYDDTASTAGSGGAIGFGANTGASQRTWIAAIESRRDSATNDATNYAGSLVFYTRPAQSPPVERMRISSVGTVLVTPDLGQPILDTTGTATVVAAGASVNFPTASGMLMVNNWNQGTVGIWLCGGGGVNLIGSSNATYIGTVSYSAAINGYQWTSTAPNASPYTFTFIRTRSNA